MCKYSAESKYLYLLSSTPSPHTCQCNVNICPIPECPSGCAVYAKWCITPVADPGFPRREALTPKVGQISPKTARKWRKLEGRGRGRVHNPMHNPWVHANKYSICVHPLRHRNRKWYRKRHENNSKQWILVPFPVSDQGEHFLLPANQVWGKVIFSQACVICGEGGRGRGIYIQGRWADPHRILWTRSTSGWYASYWNAYLLHNILVPIGTVPSPRNAIK